MTSSHNPQELAAFIPSWAPDCFSPRQRALLKWLVSATESEVVARRVEARAEYERRELLAAPYDRVGAIGAIFTSVVAFLGSVQFFGQAAWLKQIHGFPPFAVTLSVFLVMLVATLASYRLAAKKRRYGQHRNDERSNADDYDLMPVPSFSVRRMVDESLMAKAWYEHVDGTLGRGLCRLESEFMRAFSVKDRHDPDTKRQFEQYVAPDNSLDALTLEELKALGVPDGQFTSDELLDLLHASEDSLVSEQTRLEGLTAARARRETLMEPLIRPFAGAAMFMGFGWLLAIPAGLWAAWRLTAPPAILTWLAGGGITATVLSVVCVEGMIGLGHESADAERNRLRLRELQEVSAPGWHEMLCAFDHSLNARRWHHHVVHIQKRKFRWVDVFFVRSLLRAEQAAKTNAAS